MRVRLWAPAMLLAVAGTCSAQDAWRGIWEGTIGQMPVRVCLDGKDGEGSRYYYLKYGKDILLHQSEGEDGGWQEAGEPADNPGGKWQLVGEGVDAMRGSWRNANASKPLPISLKRTAVPLDGARSLCEAEYFFKQLADAQKPVTGPVQTFGRHQYRTLASGPGGPAALAVVLLGFGANGDTLNKLQQQRLRERMARGSDTRRGGLAESYEKVVWLSDRWLTLRELEWPRGYGGSGIDSWYETWDLSTSTKVDLWRWFNARAGVWQGEEFTPSKALTKAIGGFDDNGGDPDCKGQKHSWGSPRLAVGGIEFEAGYGPCLGVATASFRTLQPFLNEEGLRQAAALQREAVKP